MGPVRHVTKVAQEEEDPSTAGTRSTSFNADPIP